MRCPSPVALCAALAIALPSAAAAQSPDRGAFVSRLGTDTVSVETWTRTADRLTGDRVVVVPRTELVHYAATLAPDGRIMSLEFTSRRGDALDGPAARSTSVVIGGDSADVTITVGDSTRRYRMAARPGAVPMVGSTWALYEQMVRQAARRTEDSLAVDLIFAGVLNPLPGYVKRLGRDSVAFGYFGNPLLARVDGAGRVLGFDGSRTTQKFTITRQPAAGVMALARAFAARESAAGPAGMLSSRDTVQATVGAAAITIDYGRPRRRGREIFGGIVPFGEVWRTGANAATGFTTDRDLTIGGAAVPAGSYTLWTLPTPDGATLIVNRQTGQWGTDYQEAEDLVRVPMRRRTLAEPVETFTISVDPSGLLSLHWDRTAWDIEIKD
jgi:hypothetical protein